MGRRIGLGSALAVCCLLAVAGLSWACVPIQGNTWYSDGQFVKSGPAGTVVSAFATGAMPDLGYLFVSGQYNGPPSDDQRMGCADQSVPINPNVRYSNSRGFIPNTSGPVNRPLGEWQICFKEANPPGTHTPWITNAVFFTVV